MRLRFNQLERSLDKRLAPVYLIAGDEPLQSMLAADAVRAAARAHGYDERVVLEAESGFDWSALRAAADAQSLFTQRRVLDLRVSGRPNAQGGKALAGYAERPAPDTVLLVQSARLDRAALNGQWVKALDRAGVVLQVWPLDARESVQWIASRLVEKGLKAGREVAELIADRAQGNMLAADQEIVKLSLLYGGALPDKERLLADISDSARFNVFELAAAAIAGDCARAVRILQGLAAEDVKPALVLWSLCEQTRLLASIADQLGRGVRLEQAIPRAQQRHGLLLRQALKRQDVAAWESCLRQCAHVDRTIKGSPSANAWDELLALTLSICGRPLFCLSDERD